MAVDNLPYSVGTIKLTWIDPSDYTILNSRMFESLEGALKNVPKDNDNWMIFELKSTDGTSYSWKLLPYGQSKEYISGMQFRDSSLLYYGGISLMILGAYSLLRMIGR